MKYFFDQYTTNKQMHTAVPQLIIIQYLSLTLITRIFNVAKSGLPQPEVGSQPIDAVKPLHQAFPWFVPYMNL